MAYIIRRPGCEFWNGPFPNKAGEFDMNVHPKWVRHEPPKGRIYGKCAARAGCSSAELHAKGYVGLYCDHDIPLIEIGMANTKEIREVDTDVLQEAVVSGERPARVPFVPGVTMNPFDS